MSPCQRFEEEGLLQIEKGEALDEHFQTCPECIRERARYDQMKYHFKKLSADLQPDPGWEEKVLAAVRSNPAVHSRPEKSRWALVAGALVACAALVLFGITILLEPGQRGDREFRVELAQAGALMRNGEAAPGDELRLSVQPDDYQFVELRVYLDGKRLAFQCGSGQECQRTGNDVLTQMELRSPGTYQPVALLSNSAIPPSSGNMDQDLLRAREAGSEVLLGVDVKVY